jgi:hypothetical protein
MCLFCGGELVPRRLFFWRKKIKYVCAWGSWEKRERERWRESRQMREGVREGGRGGGEEGGTHTHTHTHTHTNLDPISGSHSLKYPNKVVLLFRGHDVHHTRVYTRVHRGAFGSSSTGEGMVLGLF